MEGNHISQHSERVLSCFRGVGIGNIQTGRIHEWKNGVLVAATAADQSLVMFGSSLAELCLAALHCIESRHIRRDEVEEVRERIDR